MTCTIKKIFPISDIQNKIFEMQKFKKLIRAVTKQKLQIDYSILKWLPSKLSLSLSFFNSIGHFWKQSMISKIKLTIDNFLNFHMLVVHWFALVMYKITFYEFSHKGICSMFDIFLQLFSLKNLFFFGIILIIL